MNKIETDMIALLKELKESYCVVGVKAEFEAEGTRLDEAILLKNTISCAKLPYTIKIGGCEALKDLMEAKLLGARAIVAPMVESAYALRKYLQAVKKVYSTDERQYTKFYINVETYNTVLEIEKMFLIPEIEILDGVVLGRGDLCGSMGMTRKEVNDKCMFDIAEKVFAEFKSRGFDCLMGGGVTVNTLDFIRRLPKGNLDRFETRKIVFDAKLAERDNAADGLNKALKFELLWLKMKRAHYEKIASEDNDRIADIEKRMG